MVCEIALPVAAAVAVAAAAINAKMNCCVPCRVTLSLTQCCCVVVCLSELLVQITGVMQAKLIKSQSPSKPMVELTQTSCSEPDIATNF